MEWQDISEYNGDFALVKFIDSDGLPLVGIAIRFKNQWKEPYSGVQYVNNTGRPLEPVEFVNLDDLTYFLD